MTPTQEETLKMITDYKAKEGHYPSVWELARETGIDHVSIGHRIKVLEREKIIKWNYGDMEILNNA